MRWLKKALAGYNYGKALGKFYKGRYEEAALLFERVLRVNTDDRKELSQAY